MNRAREELELEAGEFELAVQLGEVHVPPAGQGRWRVMREEVDRLRTAEGYPQSLRDRLRVVGSGDGAELMGVSRDRFVKLAKGGFIRPVRWYVNRYRAVVWMYLADEVGQYARDHPELLLGRLPVALRSALDESEDHRARGWRARRAGQLVRDAADAWEEAAVWAALLGTDGAAEVVPDLYERAYLRRLRSGLPPGRPGEFASREAIDAAITADHPDEIALARLSLAEALDRARHERPAPRPATAAEPEHRPGPRPEQRAHRSEPRPESRTEPCQEPRPRRGWRLHQPANSARTGRRKKLFRRA
ncbi:DUF6397 family protein [Streptomyces sp. H10-C2]|uniref:DUF6397 family protein n=1 Tax=unclassified Streptomyces TaxID=2593676 RepID=UPI0024BAE6F5|nr:MULTISPECIES: DUF6397 family protein [unclassified Streptomyces]MDJ0342984.1 DUF6397 family protein [Streptomyces sp. PH10-H1]MDJ0371455.1 DUF6397 family protein [Streptomyces sp. H10-C2]